MSSAHKVAPALMNSATVEQDLTDISLHTIELPAARHLAGEPSVRAADVSDASHNPAISGVEILVLPTPSTPTTNSLPTTDDIPTSSATPIQATVSVVLSAPATNNTQSRPPPAPGVFMHPSSTSASTFNGGSAPLIRLWLRAIRYMAASVLGRSATSAELYIVRGLFIVDNVNPIAWGKLTTWFFHPGRHVKRQHRGLQIYIRIMFLLTNFLTVFIQYSGLLLTPAEKFRSSFIANVMNDSISDGIKYSGFTNHLLQTFFLYRPQGDFGRAMVNGSRLYMEDVLFAACLCAPTMIFIVESSPWVTRAYIIYAILVWLDFILKRFKPQNFVRRKIAVLANEVRNGTDRTNPGPGTIQSASPADAGFPVREKQAGELLYYTIFFLTNAVLRVKVYRPLWLVAAAKLSTQLSGAV